MIKVLFDYQIFNMQQIGGISRYFANLITGLNNLKEVNTFVSIIRSNNKYLKNKIKCNFFDQSIQKSWNRRFNRWMVRLNNYDILHPTYYDAYFLKYTKKPFVITVHDMIHEN